MIPQLTGDGERIRIPIGDTITAPLIDALAITYTDDPEAIGRLLAVHAAAVLNQDHAEVSEDTPEWERAMRAALADGSREALLAELPEDHSADPEYGPDAADDLAGRITSLAARIRTTTPKGTRT
ncbi:hypothetical protein ACFQ61_01975 [Streptomyces sp. NPDC056500]|uniref:hypothetical protein n=1 Tax=Streptomyces sp. NPDC056500 TaxID=3345840 RepID=UPI0036B573C3